MTNKLTDEQRCNCHSCNWQEGETPNVILAVPEDIRRYTDGRETVCIDACIAETIKALWDAGLPTLNSCCGHNKTVPSLVIPDEFDPQRYISELREIDFGRAWVVSRWTQGRIGWSTHEYETPLSIYVNAPERVYLLLAELQKYQKAANLPESRYVEGFAPDMSNAACLNEINEVLGEFGDVERFSQVATAINDLKSRLLAHYRSLPVLPNCVFQTMAVRWPLTAEQIKRLCRELQLEMEKHAGQPDEQA